jgi:hypothetical protein
MKNIIIKLISYLSLVGTIVPAILVFFNAMDLQTNKTIMAVSMVIWFATAPLWINEKSKEEAVE